MSHVSYQISGGMASADVRKIHDQALGLIDRVGLRVPHEPTLRLISDYDGVSVAGDRVRFRPELVQAALAAQSYPSPRSSLTGSFLSSRGPTSST